jgi:hypothetical protein
MKMGCGCSTKIKPIGRIKPREPKEQIIRTIPIHFDHGGGDCVHFAHLLQVYKEYGFQTKVHYEDNKDIIWKAAGVEYTDSGPYHPWAYYGGFNEPTPNIEWSGNKIALNINQYPLPDIGTVEEIWEKLCNVNLETAIEPFLTKEAMDIAGEMVENLPRPIVLIHSHGTNMAEFKNIPNQIVMDLYRELLSRMAGSVIICDWDNRVPLLSHARVRHLKDIKCKCCTNGHHWSLLEFYALSKLASLLIGVDSCPYHFASMTTMPVLGVFHHHYPSCITLPRAKNINMTRNAESYRPVNQARRDRWNIVEYSGTYPTATDITKHALRILEGPRYGLPIGRDIMMQQWIRDWCLASTSTSPFADRNSTLDYLFREMTKRFESPIIVETGCSRSPEDWSAGNSTYLFKMYERGNLTSVDNDISHCNFASKMGVNVINSDSVAWLKNHQNKIDVLYLDSMDCEEPNHAEHGLEEIKAAEHCLHEESLVVYDDTAWKKGWIGKGAKGVPYLLQNGWKIVSMGYQVILSRKP